MVHVGRGGFLSQIAPSTNIANPYFSGAVLVSFTEGSNSGNIPQQNHESPMPKPCDHPGQLHGGEHPLLIFSPWLLSSEDQPRRKKKTLTKFHPGFQFEAQPSIKHCNLIFKDSIGIPFGLHLHGHISRRKPGLTVLQWVRSSSALSAWTWLRQHRCQSKRLKDLQHYNRRSNISIYAKLSTKHWKKMQNTWTNWTFTIQIATLPFRFPFFSPFSLPGLALGSSGTFAEAKEKATSAWISPHRHSIGWFSSKGAIISDEVMRGVIQIQVQWQ